MPFQRSYSKVWWGSDNQLPANVNININSSSNNNKSGSGGGRGSTRNVGSFTSGGLCSYFSQRQTLAAAPLQQFGGSTYHSLDLHHLKSNSGNLSRIQEVDDEHNASKLSWEKRDSPGSLRSQDSGFSDNDESQSIRSLSGRSSKTASPSAKSTRSTQSDVGSPTSTRSVDTPPTVVRRTGRSEFYTPLVSISRRISFTGSPAASKSRSHSETADTSLEEDGSSTLMAQLDNIQFDVDDATAANTSDVSPMAPATGSGQRSKRRRKVCRKVTKPLSFFHKRSSLMNTAEEGSDLDDESDGKEATNGSRLSALDSNNETMYLGCASSSPLPPPPPYNNETVVFGGPIEAEEGLDHTDHTVSPLRLSKRHSGNTSTPKARKNQPDAIAPAATLSVPHEYENPLLNGHPPALQRWLVDLRSCCEHEVMSTLQTKSIVQEAFKNLTITTSTVAKLIRQLQQRALYLQSSFERVERMLTGVLHVSLHEALFSAGQLVEHVAEFAEILQRRAVFFAGSRADRKRYDEHIDQIRIVAKDTRYSLERQHYINLESLLEDVQVLRHKILIAVREVFARMVRILVQSVEQAGGGCDLMLRANINMIATLMNIDYEGFASLTAAFVESEAVRALLLVCLDHKLSSVRALALRALATVCCAPAPIAQLGSAGGIEIIRDILKVSGTLGRVREIKRSDTERREAVSLLTQITAAWHGPEHRVDGLRDCVESIVEGVTQLLFFTDCPQTLLLCAAALNNLSRIEVTAHYSIMSHETIFKLISKVEGREEGISVFLYEQIVAMLHNMSLNKKCHSHLANGSIINFITSTYQAEFYKSYNSRGESDAQRRTIKTILHTLTRLVQDSALGLELLEQQQHMPTSLFLQLATSIESRQPASSDVSHGGHGGHGGRGSHGSRDISMLARQLLWTQKSESARQQAPALPKDAKEEEKCAALRLQLARQESYV